MITESEIREIGSVVKTHGIKGELNVVTDVEQTMLKQCKCIIFNVDGIYVPFFISSIRAKGAMSALVTINGIESDLEAKQFVGKSLYCLKKDVEIFYNGNNIEYFDDGAYAEEFINYYIEDVQYGKIGVITDISELNDNYLFVVKDAADNDILIPITSEFIEEIDDDEKIVYMNLPEGLIELNK